MGLPLISAAGVIGLDLQNAALQGCVLETAPKQQARKHRLTAFSESSDRARWIFEAPAGIYRLEVRARSPHGIKYFQGKVARCPFSGFFEKSDEFRSHSCGLVELEAGRNELEIGGGWGYFEIAGLPLTPAEVPGPPSRPTRRPRPPPGPC